MSWRRGQAYAQHLRDRVLAAIDRGMGAYQAGSAVPGQRVVDLQGSDAAA